MRRALAALLLVAAAPAPDSAAVFDRVWRDVGQLYWDAGMRGVDWDAARARFRPQAMAARDPDALYAILDRMLDPLHDSHVFALPPGEARYEAARDAGDAQPGFGFASWLDGADWRVYAVTPGGEAARAGVRAGWRLLTVDGTPVDIDRHPLPGQRGRLVFADLLGHPHAFDLAAAPTVPLPTVRTQALAGGALWIALDGFDAHEDRRLAAILRATPPPAAVILDLRDDDGGEEETAARVAGLFFASRHTLLRRIGRHRAEKVPTEGTGRRSYAGPITVLVGPRSASAAEALAAMLQESGRAVTVGERTAGALTGASVEPLPDGGQLSIAQFDVRTPGGQRIEGRGFTPAYVVPLTPDDMAAGRDPPLAAAERLLAPSLSGANALHARP